MINREQVSVDGVSTAFFDTGRGATIVALHGIPTSSALFEPLLPHLRDYRVIAPDLIGHGGTEAPADRPLNYSAYKAHLDAFLATAPPDEFCLLVHDLGGVLGLEWAAEHRERVHSLIVLSTTVAWSIRIEALLHANLLLGRSFVRWVMPAALERHQPLAPALLETWAAPWTRRRAFAGLDLFGRSRLSAVRSKLASLDVPALLLWGENDKVFPLSYARTIAAGLPQSTLVTIPRCGHWSALDAPEEVARQVVGFLNCSGEPRRQA